jgi:hypothetical protein
MSNVWKTLSAIDCSKHVEKKNGFTYLSWAWAWSILKQHYPTAHYTKHLFQVNGNQLPYMLDAEGNAYVTVTVKILDDSNPNGVSAIESATEIMPVLNHANRPIKNPNSFEVNASLQRCMVKAIAALGLGCYIYAGEDLPVSLDTGGGGSPSQKPVTGRTSSAKPSLSYRTTEPVDEVQMPKKIGSPLSIEQEIAIAPDVESLRKLYSRLGQKAVQYNGLFTKRKKELEANG